MKINMLLRQNEKRLVFAWVALFLPRFYLANSFFIETITNSQIPRKSGSLNYCGTSLRYSASSFVL